VINKNKIAVTGFALIPLYIVLDQLSKWIVLDWLFRPELGREMLGFFGWAQNTERLPYVNIEVLPFFDLTMVWNQGVSFGMFQSGNIWPLTIIALVISTFFAVWLARAKSWVEGISLSLIIGGALGNVIDRFHFGAVADFIDIYYQDWHYPAFNLADSFITVGIVILVIHSLFFSAEGTKGK
jgi:signal peptidase II